MLVKKGGGNAHFFTHGPDKNRMLEGKAAEEGEYPWMVRLVYLAGGSNTIICSGALISARAVLTAAHCLVGFDPAKFFAMIGSSTATALTPEDQ